MDSLHLTQETREKLSGNFVELKDGWTHYEISGPDNGLPLMLIHGNAAPMQSWDNNTGYFNSRGFKVIRYDVFGHGFSDRPMLKRYDMELYLNQLDGLIECLGIEKVYLAGTSQGGAIAANYAALNPDKVIKIAFLSPYVDAHGGLIMTKLLRSRMGESIMAKFGERALAAKPKGFISGTAAADLGNKLKVQFEYEGRGRAVLANLRGDSFQSQAHIYRRIARSNIPSFISWGECDTSIPYASIERLRKIIPDAEYHQLSRAAHLAHYELSEILNPLIADFFISK